MEKLVTRIPKLIHIYNGPCKGCVVGKNTKKSFPHSLRKTKYLLEQVHSNLCGPIFLPSIGGFFYYVIFVDDFSRKTWIYFLKCKESEEILSKFKEFKTITENSSRKNIKVLRTDNGKEYTSEIFKEFCKLSRIKREFTVPYNPKQNGVVERKNRTIVEAARAMIYDQNLSMSFVMSPILSISEFQGLAYYCDSRRLIIVDRGSSEAVASLGRVFYSL